MRQEWVCEGCGISGVVEHEPNAGIFAVVHAIEDHHDRLAHEHAPYCRFDVHKVRVRDSDTDIYAWNRFVASLERIGERDD